MLDSFLIMTNFQSEEWGKCLAFKGLKIEYNEGLRFSLPLFSPLGSLKSSEMGWKHHMGPTALPQQWSPPLGIFPLQASSLGGIGGGVLHFQVLCLLHFLE